MPSQTKPNREKLTRRHILKGLMSALCLPITPSHAQGVTISAVRVWPAKEYTRITLEHDHDILFNCFLVENPERLVVDIEGLQLNNVLRNLASGVTPKDPYIRNIRVSQNRVNVVRFVVDLKQKVHPQVFTLNAIDRFKKRLILDLYPAAESDNATDPLIELLKNQPPIASKNRSDWSETNLKKPRKAIIALDPGHGGEDPGAIGPNGTLEKTVVMQIAKKVKKRLETDPNILVLLTREEDYFVPLNQRVEKARAANADLFVSLHADAFVTPQAQGSSVFILSEKGASSTTARWLAKKENASDLIGGANIRHRDKQVAKVLLDLSTTAQINDSLKLGGSVLKHLAKVNKLHKIQIEQANFAVLKAPDIPSILIETAFISNPQEELRLRSTSFQESLAKSIASGIKEHLKRYPQRSETLLASSKEKT